MGHLWGGLRGLEELVGACPDGASSSQLALELFNQLIFTSNELIIILDLDIKLGQLTTPKIKSYILFSLSCYLIFSS